MGFGLNVYNRKSLALASLAMVGLGLNGLSAGADVNVTDGGDDATYPYTSGQLRYAINEVNAGTPGPISIESGATPVELTASMIAGTTSMTIRSDSMGSSRTITGAGGVQTYVGISAGSGGVITLSSDILLSGVGVEANMGSVIFQGPQNFSSLSNSGRGLTLAGTGTAEFSASGTLSAQVTIENWGIVKVDSGESVTFAGGISGFTGLDAFTLNGIGSLTLTGSASSGLSSMTVSQAGSLIVSGTNLLPSGALVDLYGNGATLQLNASNAILNLKGNNDSHVILASGTLTFGDGTSQTFSGSITGAGGLVKNGTGIFTLSGELNNTYSGTTVINQGTLQNGSSYGLAFNSLVNLAESGATLDVNGRLASISNVTGTTGSILSLNGGNLQVGDGTNQTFFGTITGDGALAKDGTGVLTLSGTGNVYSAQTNIESGTLRAGVVNAFSPNSFVWFEGDLCVLDLNGYDNTILNLAGLDSVVNTGVTLGSGILTFGDDTGQTFYGSITGSGGLVKNGTGTFTLSGSGGIGANTYSGTTLINAGVFQSGENLSFSANSLVNLAESEATLDVKDHSEVVLNITGTTGSSVTLGSGILTFGDVLSTTFAGNVTGEHGGLTKIGTGTFTLFGTNNTYSGTTAIDGGIFQAGAENVFSPNSAVVLSNSSAVLDLEGYDNTIANLYGEGSVTLDSGTLTLGGDNESATFFGSIAGAEGALTKIGTGVFTLSGTSNTYSGTTAIGDGMIQAGGPNVFSPDSLVYLYGEAGTLDLAGHNNTILNLSSDGENDTTYVLLGSGTLTFGDGTDQYYAGHIAGTGGGLVKNGTGTFYMTADSYPYNTYTGTTLVNEGTFAAAGSNGTGAFSPYSLVDLAQSDTALALNDQDNTILNLTGTTGSFVELGSGTLTFGDGTDQTFFGIITGSGGGLTKEGTGTFTLAGSGNAYSGSTIVVEGTFEAGTENAFSLDSLIDLSERGTVLNLSNYDNAIRSLVGTTGTLVLLGGGTLTIEGDVDPTFAGDITGTGGLIKNGPDTLTLTGTGNTYSGTTAIGEGSLQSGVENAFSPNSLVNITGTTGTLDLDGHNNTILNLTSSVNDTIYVLLGSGTLTLGDSTDQSYYGRIVGTGGGIVKNGTGTLFLNAGGSDFNSYTGTTLINAGTLAAGIVFGEGSFPLHSLVDLVNPGTALVLNGRDNRVGNITGTTGSVINLGSGVLAFGDGTDQTFFGIITGTGGKLAKEGTGTFTLMGTSNTYSGTTRIREGVFQAGGNDVFSPNSLVSIATGATLSLDGFTETTANLRGSVDSFVLFGAGGSLTTGGDDGSHTFAGILSGSGTLIKVGTGTLTLTGANTFGGLTEVFGGTLVTSSLSQPTDVVNRSVLTFNETSDAFYGLTITGSGSFNKTGDGLLTITGDVIQETVTVEEGGLKVGVTGNLLVTGTLTVDNGATVGGCGRIVVEDGFVIDGGFTPGCSATLLTVVGDVKMNADSTFTETIQGIGYPFVNVEGTVNLDPPTLNINLSGDVTPILDERVAFITTTGGLTGTFGDILINSAVIRPIVTYDSHSAYFELHLSGFFPFAASGNAGSVAKALDAVYASGSGAMDSIIGQLLVINTQAQLEYTLDQMQPALYKGLAISQESSAVQVQGALNFRMQTVLDETHCYAVFEKEENGKKVPDCKNGIQPIHAWVGGIGDILNQSSNTYADSPQVGYQDTTTGVVTGVDYRFGKYVYLGALGAYTYSNIDWRNGQGRGDIKTGYGGLYLSGISDIFYGNLAVTGAWSRYHAYRDIYFPTDTYTAKNNHGGAQLLTHVDTGFNLGWGGITIRPFDSFDYITQTENTFTETGAGELDLNVAGTNAILLRNELGLNFAGCLCMGDSKWTIAPKLSWVREVRIKGSTYNCEFVNTDVPFTVTGYFPDRGLLSPGVTVNGSMRNDLLNVGLYYNGEFTHGYSNHRYGAQIRFGF